MWWFMEIKLLYLRFMIHLPAQREEFHLLYMKRFVLLEAYVQKAEAWLHFPGTVRKDSSFHTGKSNSTYSEMSI